MDVTTVGPLRNGLIKKGMVFSPQHGDAAFTVPVFDEFKQRSIPDWEPGSTVAAKKARRPQRNRWRREATPDDLPALVFRHEMASARA